MIAGHWDARYPEARDRPARLGIAERSALPAGPRRGRSACAAERRRVLCVPVALRGALDCLPLEALACGAPVLSGDSSSLPEVVGEAALRVDMRSVAALSAAMARLLGDAALREQLRHAGPQRAAQFSWRRTAEATLEVYQQAIEI